MSIDNGRRGVVVGFDGSAYAMQALDWALDEAEWRSLPLTLCHAWKWPYPKADEAGRRSLRLAAEHVLAHGVECARDRTADVTVKSALCEGSAAERLAELSEDAELVVVGSRGLGGLARAAVGSVAERVAAHAACPVIIVRGAGSLPRRHPRDPVTVGVDGSAAARAAADFAAREAELRGTPLRIVHGCGDPGAARAAGLDLALGNERLEEIAATVRERHPGLRVEPELVVAPARRALADAAGETGLLVVGVPRHRPALGSLPHWLLHRTTCPVAIVPEPVAVPVRASRR